MDDKYTHGIKSVKNVFKHEENVIPIFNSLDIYRDYMLLMQKQSKKEKAAGER